MQRLRLEGNFDAYFTVWCAPEYQRDILYFLTPELMQLLLDADQLFDLEIIGNQLYLYGKPELEAVAIDPTVWQKLFQSASSVSIELIENTRRYQDHRIDSAVSTLAPSGIVQARHVPKAFVLVVYALIVILVFVAVLTSS
jgi:hypothetical protein